MTLQTARSPISRVSLSGCSVAETAQVFQMNIFDKEIAKISENDQDCSWISILPFTLGVVAIGGGVFVVTVATAAAAIFKC